MNELQDSLVDALRPTIRGVVRDEIAREKLRWRWASIRQAAEILDISENALRIRCSKGQLPCRKLDGRLYIDMEALDRQLLG